MHRILTRCGAPAPDGVSCDTTTVLGQVSWLLASTTVELAITRTGGMMAPVKFFPSDPTPIAPYHVAPWAEEEVPPDSPPMLAALRGDWFCSAFGENKERYAQRSESISTKLQPHGDTANGAWQLIGRDQCDAGAWVQLGIDLPLQGGRCESVTALLPDHSVIYQRHDLSGLTGPINPGHHATLQLPDDQASGHFSCSPLVHAQTCFEPIDGPGSSPHSCLRPNVDIVDLGKVPTVDGLAADLRYYPARRGFDDLIILCADPSLALAWAALTFPKKGFVWFALRSPRLLASTLLWFSNGGRRFAPWNGRHFNVMGIEDVTAYFHAGLALSARENPLNKQGVRTCLEPDGEGCLSIPYIQGVARIPNGFDRLAAIEPLPEKRSIRLRSYSGLMCEVSCDLDFLRRGRLHGLEMP